MSLWSLWSCGSINRAMYWQRKGCTCSSECVLGIKCTKNVYKYIPQMYCVALKKGVCKNVYCK